jgi:hypothetical protein
MLNLPLLTQMYDWTNPGATAFTNDSYKQADSAPGQRALERTRPMYSQI